MTAVLAVDVVEETERAQVLLHPTRLALLERLDDPASAAAHARRLGLPRQRVNYHLRELESGGLVRLVEERRRGSCVERVYRRTGRAYAISRSALGALGTSPEAFRDRFSAAYQIALAARAIDELGSLQAGAAAAGKRLATLALEAEVRFASPEARSAFADELADAVARLVEKYHAGGGGAAGDPAGAPEGRTFRLYAGGYPRPKGPE